MKKLKNYLVAIGAVALMVSCYPGGPSYVEDYDITFATKADDADFSTKAENTYVMPSEVYDIGDSTQNIDPINPALEAKILSRVQARMTDYGYDKLPDSDKFTADYAVVVQRLISDNWVTYYWGGGGWGCGWYSYWCGGGYYPPSGSTYNYQTGTLYVSMIDINKSDTTAEIPYFVWDAGINGLLGSTSTNTESRVLNGVDKMFELSPYLNKK